MGKKYVQTARTTDICGWPPVVVPELVSVPDCVGPVPLLGSCGKIISSPSEEPLLLLFPPDIVTVRSSSTTGRIVDDDDGNTSLE